MPIVHPQENHHTKPEAPFFSICIPQYNRTAHLIHACRMLARQTYTNFEICISDDKSTDGKEHEVLKFLEASRIPFTLKRQTTNVGYDANLRASISLARGRFCFLHGNDDCLADDQTLEKLHDVIVSRKEPVGVIVTNFKDWRSGKITKRVTKRQIEAKGPAIAVARFRNLAFVSGVILCRERAQEFATRDWDSSEMYQMYVGCKIIASGYSLLETDVVAISKDVTFPGEQVDTYAARPKIKIKGFPEIRLPLSQIGRVVANAIAPYVPPSEQSSLYRRIFFQLYMFTYPFWYIEYRRVQSWKYALCLGRGLRPKHTCAGLRMNWRDKLSVRLIYFLSLMTGLLVPFSVFSALRPILFRIAKLMRGHY